MKYIVNLLFIFSLYACSEDFYDTEPYDGVSAENAIATEADMDAAMNGCYAGLRSSNAYGSDIPFVNEVLADNIYRLASAGDNTNRYAAQFNYNYTTRDVYFANIWRQAYTVIARANNVINASITSTANVKQLRGEAYTVRALLYFELVRMYAKPFAQGGINPGVPLVLKYNLDEKPPRASVQAVYDRIVQDLDSAFLLMTNTSKNSSYITKYVAKAIQAKVYLYRGEYAAAAAASKLVVQSGGYTLTDNYLDYWESAANRSDKVETIFEISCDAINNNGFDELGVMYSQVSPGGDALCSTALSALYGTNDVRKNIFQNGDRSGTPAIIINKYPNTSSSGDRDNIKVMRYADLLLIFSEALYKTGKEDSARIYLNTVAVKREPSLTPYSVSGQALLEQIILERRKELAFEGDRFPDLNRLGLTISRTSEFADGTQSIPSSDHRRVAPLPQYDYDANPNLRPQNDGYNN